MPVYTISTAPLAADRFPTFVVTSGTDHIAGFRSRNQAKSFVAKLTRRDLYKRLWEQYHRTK